MTPVVPPELSSFVGREHELNQVVGLIGERRLVVLTGPGGVGKSRLALRAVRLLRLAEDDATCWLDVASVHAASHLPGALAEALGLRVWGDAAETRLLAALRHREALLLLLDNCEHLLQGCAELTLQLLSLCPGVRILATSRERLGVGGEVVMRVPPMSTSAPGTRPAALGTADAARLFVERAREVDPQFALSESTAPAIINICHSLDGLPLAIELAAAWVGTLSISQLARRIADPLGLLTRGARFAPERQHTLRATLDWSVGELTDDESRVFRRLAVFVNSFDLDAADAVCSDAASGTIATPLAGLVERSLVQLVDARSAQPTRYRLLETVRHYAYEQLHTAGELEAIRERHADWYRRVAEQLQMATYSVNQVDRLRAEHANLRAALGWAVEQRQVDLALELVDRLHAVWYMQGQFAEATGWFEQVLALPGGSPSLRAIVATWASYHAACLGEMGRARALQQQARERGAAIDDHLVQAVLLDGEAAILLNQAALEPAGSVLESERELCLSTAGLEWLLAAPNFRLAEIRLEQGALDDAWRLCQESMARLGLHANAWVRMHNQRVLGRVAMARGDVLEADQQFSAALATARRLGDIHGIVQGLIYTSVLAQLRRDLPGSRGAVREALELAEAGSEPIILIWTVEQIAALAAVPRPEAAVHLANLAGRLRERFGTPAWPAERARLDRLLDAARERLGGGPHGGETVPGGALTPTTLASVAHSVLNSLAAPQRRHDRNTGRPLTQRELVVARLAASGRTNRSIARELLISEGTVRVHVEHILHKLELQSRHELARRLATIDAED